MVPNSAKHHIQRWVTFASITTLTRISRVVRTTLNFIAEVGLFITKRKEVSYSHLRLLWWRDQIEKKLLIFELDFWFQNAMLLIKFLDSGKFSVPSKIYDFVWRHLVRKNHQKNPENCGNYSDCYKNWLFCLNCIVWNFRKYIRFLLIYP